MLTTSFDRNVRRPRFSADGSSIYFIAVDDGTQNLCRIAVGGGEVTRPIGGRVTVSSYSLGKDGAIAAQIGTTDRPDEIFLQNGSDLTRLTKTNDALISQLRLAKVEYVHFKSKDGTAVAGYLYKPVDFDATKKVPTLLNPHGGPVGEYEASFYHLGQLYAANGYAVLLPNPRGSSGYGEKFCAAIYADWGNKDFQDDMAMVDYALEQGIADPDKLGVGGWSYGGISTDFIIGQTTQFKAAISGAGVALITSFYGHDHYQRDYETELGYPVGTSGSVGQNLAFLPGQKHHDADAFHGRRNRFERADPWKRADVSGHEGAWAHYGTRRVSGRISRFHGAVAHQGSARALPRLVCALCQRRRNAGYTCGTNCSGSESGRRQSGRKPRRVIQV